MERSYIGPSFADAKVSDAMRVGVITCRPDAKLAEVAQMMVGYDVHSVVVAEGSDAAKWGIVTSLDLARRPNELETLAAGEIAHTNLITIESNQPLGRAAELMAEHGVTHLIAVQPDTGRPAGMISARGLAGVLAYGSS